MVPANIYRYPVAPGTATTEEKKSRFIGTVYAAYSKDEAMSQVSGICRLHPKANHHCYAYIIGHPAKPAESTASDDGEPSGTAGRPMLSILQQEGIGDIVVVVTRYFGGIKLGTGGLVRAYSRALQAALAECILAERSEMKKYKLDYGYEFDSVVKGISQAYQAITEHNEYTNRISSTIFVPLHLAAPFELALREQSGGRIMIDATCE